MLKFDFNFIWTIINLIIFFVLMRLFLFKPIKKVMDARKDLIDRQFREADSAKAEADKLKDEYQYKLTDADAEKKQIIAEAKKSAKTEYDKILDKAQLDADRIMADAHKAAAAETEKARLSVKEEIASLAMETAEKVVGSRASAEIDSELYDKFLNEGSEE